MLIFHIDLNQIAYASKAAVLMNETFISDLFLILQGEEDWVVFLFIKGENQGVKNQWNKPLPSNVQNIVKDAKTALPYNVCKEVVLNLILLAHLCQ